MEKIIKILLVVLLLAGCSVKVNERVKTDRNGYTFSDYDYVVECYYNTVESDNLYQSDFYRNDTLIRTVMREGGCSEFMYDSIGRLIEIDYGRDCSYCGLRKLLIYDTLGNHIGFFLTNDSIIDLDTVEFEQIYFYNANNQLIKERTRKSKDVYGNEFEIWKYYSFVGDKKVSDVILQNTDTIWNSRYFYDSRENLILIHRTIENVYEKEIFTYDKNNLLIKYEIQSTANPVTENTSFSAGNNFEIYEYDSSGFKTFETLYNHEGKEQVKKTYLKKYK